MFTQHHVGPLRPLAAVLLVLLGVFAPAFPVAAQDEEDGLLSATEYESPQFGHSVEWDDSWTADEIGTISSEDGGFDLLVLSGFPAIFQVYAAPADGITANEQIENSIETYTEEAEDFKVINQAGDEDLAAAVVEYDLIGDLVRDLTEVRMVDGGDTLLTVVLFAPVDDFEEQVARAQETITLDGEAPFSSLDLVDISSTGTSETATETDTGTETETETATETETETETSTDTETESAESDVTPQYRGGAARTGEQPGPAPEGEPETLWTYETGDDFGALSPAISGELIFFGPNALYGVELATGDLDGSLEEDVGFVAPMAAADGVVYAAWEGGAIYALDPAEKEVIWMFDTGGEALIGGTPVVGDGVVYVPTYDGDLFAIDAEEGEEVWSAEIGSSVVAPALVDGILYVAGGNPATMYAFDPESGDELWSREYGGNTTYGAFAVADDTIYAANSDGVLYALSTEDGAEVWTAELENSDATGTPAVANGVVYAAGDGEDFYALDAENGEELWSVQLGADSSSQPVVVEDTVFIGDTGSTLYALSTEDGEEVWTVDLDGAVEGSPVILDGVIYVDSAGTINALGEE